MTKTDDTCECLQNAEALEEIQAVALQFAMAIGVQMQLRGLCPRGAAELLSTLCIAVMSNNYGVTPDVLRMVPTEIEKKLIIANRRVN